jgi:DNA-binding CsgD family transcriptional regulator
MNKIDKIFYEKNTIKDDLDNDGLQPMVDYMEVVDTISQLTYNSIYIIDYKKQNFEYVSNNPLFLCGLSPDEVKKKGYTFYFDFVPKEDVEFLIKVNQLVFDFYSTIPIAERKLYSTSYDFHLKSDKEAYIKINHKLTPLVLTKDGKIWKSICIVSLSSKREFGNVTIHKQGRKTYWEYNFKTEYWEVKKRKILSKREKDILILSAQGYCIDDLATQLFLSPETVKFHRRKIFEKLEVNNMIEAVSYAVVNKLI